LPPDRPGEVALQTIERLGRRLNRDNLFGARVESGLDICADMRAAIENDIAFANPAARRVAIDLALLLC